MDSFVFTKWRGRTSGKLWFLEDKLCYKKEKRTQLFEVLWTASLIYSSFLSSWVLWERDLVQQGWIPVQAPFVEKKVESGRNSWARPWRELVPGPWIPLECLSAVRKGAVEGMVKPEPKSGIWRLSYEIVKGKPPIFWVLICWEALFGRRNDKTSFLKTFQGRQAKLFVAENNNLLATGDAKPWPLCIKPLKVWLHFSWMGFVLPWRYCGSWQAEVQPAKLHLPLVLAAGRFKGITTGNGASGGQLGHVPLEKDVQEWSPGAGAAWALLLFSHPAPCRIISPQVMAGTTLAVCRTGMMEDCNACEPVEISHPFDPD